MILLYFKHFYVEYTLSNWTFVLPCTWFIIFLAFHVKDALPKLNILYFLILLHILPARIVLYFPILLHTKWQTGVVVVTLCITLCTFCMSLYVLPIVIAWTCLEWICVLFDLTILYFLKLGFSTSGLVVLYFPKLNCYTSRLTDIYFLVLRVCTSRSSFFILT
jgi:hypothetical protein